MDYGRPPISQVHDDLRLPVPDRFRTEKELVAQGLSAESARAEIESEFRRFFAIPEEEDGAWIKDYEQMDVRVNTGMLQYLLSKGEGREAFLGFMKATIEDPYEVWLVEDLERKKLRKRYIGLFEKNYFVVVDRYREGWGVWDAYPVSRASAMDKQREGTLIHFK